MSLTYLIIYFFLFQIVVYLTLPYILFFNYTNTVCNMEMLSIVHEYKKNCLNLEKKIWNH